MPTYQYRCTDCGEPLEVVQSFTDDALTVCPACNGQLRKVFSSVGVVFKGSGFYRTDSRAESNGKSETKSETKTDATPKSESASESKAESKSDASSPAKPDKPAAKPDSSTSKSSAA